MTAFPVRTLAALVAALFLAACGDPTQDHAPSGDDTAATTSRSAPAGVNDADVTFVTDMIPHHQQAVELSALVPARSTDPEVVALAAEISAVQGPEIETLKAFLVQWTDGGYGGHQGHDGGAAPMPGMVDDAAMGRLAAERGSDFDRQWLQAMIAHHEGAIAMANTELATGSSSDAKRLAQQIVSGQQAEIERMQRMGMVTNGG